MGESGEGTLRRLRTVGRMLASGAAACATSARQPLSPFPPPFADFRRPVEPSWILSRSPI